MLLVEQGADFHKLGSTEIIFDISRLLSRVLFTTPTGVDRVEMAWAKMLLARMPDAAAFAAVHPDGRYGRLATSAVRKFLHATEDRWSRAADGKARSPWSQAARMLLALQPSRTPRRDPARDRIYLQVSPHHLERRALVERILRREEARFVSLVHDLIPTQYPEYARAESAAIHLARLETIFALSDGIVTNSEATRQDVQALLRTAGRDIPVHAALLGTLHTLGGAADQVKQATPYFVCIGTIEPRKNHLLLLNIWRRMAEQDRAATPRLVLIGRRGWENENVVDMLERSPALHGCVEELSGLSDDAVTKLLIGARALLLPSFAEGFGMPVTEALAAGVPVICSDLPALREAGAAVPEFLDPLDGPAWREAVDDYARADSVRRQAQLGRLAGWTPPTWDAHFNSVLRFLAGVARR